MPDQQFIDVSAKRRIAELMSVTYGVEGDAFGKLSGNFFSISHRRVKFRLDFARGKPKLWYRMKANEHHLPLISSVSGWIKNLHKKGMISGIVLKRRLREVKQLESSLARNLLKETKCSKSIVKH